MDTVFLFLRVALSLAAVLGVIWYIQRRLARNGGRARAAKTITVVARQPLGSKASVAVIEVGGQRFVLGVTEHAVSTLHTLPVAEHVESTSDAFSRVLAEAGAEAAPAEPTLVAPAPVARAMEPPRGPLAGSILSVDTWKRAFASLKP